MPEINPENLKKLVCDLRAIKIYGFGLDSLVSTYLVVNYYHRLETFTFRDWLFNAGAFLKYTLLKSNKANSFSDFIDKAPVVTFISERRHIKQLNLKVLEKLKGPVNIWTLNEVKLENNQAYNIIRRSAIEKKIDFTIGKYKTEYKAALKIFEKFCKENKLSFLRVLPFRLHLKKQLALLNYFEKCFHTTKPSFVLTELDRYTAIAPLIIAARSHQIPCFTQVHGMINVDLAYVPVLSDKVFCWGEMQARRFRELGTPDSRISITGAPQMAPVLKEIPPSDFIANKIRGKKVLLLATNPIEQQKKIELVRYFMEVINSLPHEWIGIVRLHPSEKINDYTPFFSHERLIITDNKILNYQQSLSLADVIAVFNSAFIIDALVHKKPIVQLNYFQEGLGEVENFLKEGLLPSFSNIIDTAEHCRRLFIDQEYNNLWMIKQSLLEKSYCLAYGEDAVKNILDEIQPQLKHITP